MPRVVFTELDGSESSFEAPSGTSVKDVAIEHDLDGILAECGGEMQCATCHVYVSPEWAQTVPAPSDDELAMLEDVAAPREETSRLSCQLMLMPELDGLQVTIAPDQL